MYRSRDSGSKSGSGMVLLGRLRFGAAPLTRVADTVDIPGVASAEGTGDGMLAPVAETGAAPIWGCMSVRDEYVTLKRPGRVA